VNESIGSMQKKLLQSTITVIAAGMAIAHAWLPWLKIDAITVTLLGIAAIPWLSPLFKSVEIPGGMKVEFQELEAARIKVEQSGLIEPVKVADPEDANLRPMQKHEYSFQSVAGEDSNLALSGLRIEIENRLQKLADRRGVRPRSGGAGRLTRALENAKVLAHSEAAAIRDLLPLLNQAAHGAEVDDSGFGWAMDFGPRVLGALDDRLGEVTNPQLVEDWKRRDGAGVAEIGTALSKSLVVSPNAFLESMSANPREFEAWLDDLEHHTFTIFESRSEIDDKLYMAYYEKLRELMVEAARSCLTSENSDFASRIVQKLESLNIRRIW